MRALRRWWAGIFPGEQEAAGLVGTPLLRGDELVEALMPTVADLVVAVHDMDHAGVAAAFTIAERLAGDPLAAARHLVVVLAGMASLDRSMAEQLGWTSYTRAPRTDPIGA